MLYLIIVNEILFYVTSILSFNHMEAWAKIIFVNRQNKTTKKKNSHIISDSIMYTIVFPIIIISQQYVQY